MLDDLHAASDCKRAAAAVHTLLISDHGPGGEIIAMEWPSGKVLWTKPNERSHDVQALPNGHVLFTLGSQKYVAELDQNHREVWTYGSAEGLEHPLSAQRLPNGNTLIGDAKLGRVIEVTPDKKVVWSVKTGRPHGIHEFQILDTNGKALKGEAMK